MKFKPNTEQHKLHLREVPLQRQSLSSSASSSSSVSVSCCCNDII